MIPALSRVRVLRSWGGIMDMSMDGSPIIDKTHIDGPLSQCRLVLWRLQGDAGLGLVLCPYHRQERTPQAQRRLSSRPLPPRLHDRRKGPGRHAEFALSLGITEQNHAASNAPIAVHGRRRNSPILGDASVKRPAIDRSLDDGPVVRLCLPARQSQGPHAMNTGIIPAAAAPGSWSTAIPQTHEIFGSMTARDMREGQGAKA